MPPIRGVGGTRAVALLIIDGKVKRCKTDLDKPKKCTKIKLFLQIPGRYNRWKSTLYSVYAVFRGKLTI
jgi:hypothetical protein